LKLFTQDNLSSKKRNLYKKQFNQAVERTQLAMKKFKEHYGSLNQHFPEARVQDIPSEQKIKEVLSKYFSRHSKRPRERMAGQSYYYLQNAKKQMVDMCGNDSIHMPEVMSSNLKIVLGYDQKMNKSLESAVERQLASLKRNGVDPNTVRIAGVVMNRDGLVVASYSNNVDALGTDFAAANRDFGSTIKPLLLSFALDNGVGLEDLVYSPTSLKIGSHRVHNTNSAHQLVYGGRHYIPVIHYIRDSVNTASVNLLNHMGHSKFKRFYRQVFGENPNVSGHSMALGVCQRSLEDMARAYTMFLNGGKIPVKSSRILQVQDSNGRTVISPEPEKKQIIGHQVAYRMKEVLQGAFYEGTGSRIAPSWQGWHKAFSKTGTWDKNVGCTAVFSDGEEYVVATSIAYEPGTRKKLLRRYGKNMPIISIDYLPSSLPSLLVSLRAADDFREY